MNLAVLWKIGCQAKSCIRVDRIGESDIGGASSHVLYGALRKALTTGKLEEACSVTDTDLLHQIVRPGASVVPTVLAVLSGNSHKGAAGDGAGAQGGIAVLVDEAEE